MKNVTVTNDSDCDNCLFLYINFRSEENTVNF